MSEEYAQRGNPARVYGISACDLALARPVRRPQLPMSVYLSAA
jgi:hypothetical protein